MTGDGADEIFTAAVTMGEQPAQARLLRMRGGAIELLGSCAIDSAVTSLTAASGGLLGPDQPGVLLDGAKAANTFVHGGCVLGSEERHARLALPEPGDARRWRQRSAA